MRKKSNGTHLILMELMMVLFFFAICGSILLQVFVKAHNISAKAREMTVELIHNVAMEQGLRFAIREGGRTVGSGAVATIIE